MDYHFPLVFFFLSKLLFSGFLQIKCNFVRGQNNSIHHCWKSPVHPTLASSQYLLFVTKLRICLNHHWTHFLFTVSYSSFLTINVIFVHMITFCSSLVTSICWAIDYCCDPCHNINFPFVPHLWVMQLWICNKIINGSVVTLQNKCSIIIVYTCQN